MVNQIFEKMIAEIRECINEVANDSALLYSGGIDSTVLFYIIKDIIKDNNIPVYYIETGLNRGNALDNATQFCKKYDINLNVVDITERTYTALNSIADYNKRRELLANIFLVTTREIAYGKTVVDATIKDDSRALLIETKEFKNIQPVKSLSKNDIFGLSKYLQIDKIYKAPLPFPSGGYSRKIMGEFNKKNLEMIKQVDEAFNNEISLKYGQVRFCDVILWHTLINNFIFRVSIDDKADLVALEKIIAKINKKFVFIDKCLIDVSANIKKFYT